MSAGCESEGICDPFLQEQRTEGIKFSKPRGEQKGVVTISNKNLLDPLRAVTGEDWIPGKRYRCAGSGLPMQKPCALTLMRAFRRTFACYAEQ